MAVDPMENEFVQDRATGNDAQIADDVVEEIQAEEQNDIRADTENNAFVGLDDIDLTSTQPEPQNDGRKRSNSSKRKRSHDEAIEICAENMLNAAKLISNTMSEVGKNLSDGLQYDRDMDMFQKLERALKEVDGLANDEMDLVSFKLTDHPNKVAFFLSLDPHRRLPASGNPKTRKKIGSWFNKYCVAGLWNCKAVLISGVVLYLTSIFLFKNPIFSEPGGAFFSPEAAKLSRNNESPTNISHLLFGLIGSEEAWHYRKAYTESWWRPGVTRGFLYLDVPPTGELLPWSPSSPPYRVSDDINQMVEETEHAAPIQARMVHGIMEVFRERHEGVRWVVMGDDDSVFFVENMVDVLAQYDHTKYYYFGGPSEFVMCNYWYSFNQAFGGAGFILSYPLAEALSNDMDSCLRRYAHITSADYITMLCISDLGVNLSILKGIHQVDLRGDLSGFLSSHPKFPLLSLHHLDKVEPIFPAMDRFESTKHLLRTANYDQTRMLQQNICYRRQSNWSVSVSWGYSVHIYEKIHRRSYLEMPIETFRRWRSDQNHLPLYMFNTRLPSKDPCEAPHVFFLKTVNRTEDDGIVMTYLRSSERGLPACSISGNHSAGYVSRIEVYSPSTKRPVMDRCECCDIIHSDGEEGLKVKYRECLLTEVIV
ncbi:PREDICTED: uncharacterized protein LOC109154389 [Ipomoea nil]|uniref:uncharacterized protein LOC109154389 n=1 Tax=Ipomoea nil TaxID=35883 RepID=UPI000900940E|nr:PREDICTED: uncharacterized protein LOC109154389 [Ipomoea nil]